MDEKRLIIAIVLSVLVFVVWQFFFVDDEAMINPPRSNQQPR
jgi:hypothetical protein